MQYFALCKSPISSNDPEAYCQDNYRKLLLVQLKSTQNLLTYDSLEKAKDAQEKQGKVWVIVELSERVSSNLNISHILNVFPHPDLIPDSPNMFKP